MLKVGIIGLGWAGRTHAQHLKTRDDVAIVALCDPHEDALDKAVRDFGGQGYQDFSQMFVEKKLDAVWLCTPSTIRREPLLICAAKKIPVFCEKPAELRAAEAEDIARELKKLDARVQVGFVFRSMPLTREAHKTIADDRIHVVQSLYACPVSLTRELAPWFFDKDRSGGALIDQATHNLDLLRFLFGEVAEIQGFAANPVNAKQDGYTIEETFALSLRFENGLLGTHVHSWVADAWRNEIVLLGERRHYRFDLWAGKLVVREKKGTWDFSQDQDHMYDHENDVFIEQVTSGDWSKNPSSYEDALKTLELTLQCDRSLRRK